MKKSKLIKKLKQELKFKDECLKDAANELMVNCNCLHDYIKVLENQLKQQDKVIEKKRYAVSRIKGCIQR